MSLSAMSACPKTMSECLWTVGGSWSTRAEPTQTQVRVKHVLSMLGGKAHTERPQPHGGIDLKICLQYQLNMSWYSFRLHCSVKAQLLSYFIISGVKLTLNHDISFSYKATLNEIYN